MENAEQEPGALKSEARSSRSGRRRTRVALIAVVAVIAIGAVTLVVSKNSDTGGRSGTLVDVSGNTVAVGAGPRSLVALGKYVWVANTSAGTLSKIDATATPPTVVATVPVGANPQGLYSDGTSIWVAVSGESAVKRVDPSTNTVTATVTRAPGSAFPSGYGLTEITGDAEGNIWVSLSGVPNGKVWEISNPAPPGSPAVIQDIDIAGAYAGGITFDSATNNIFSKMGGFGYKFSVYGSAFPVAVVNLTSPFSGIDLLVYGDGKVLAKPKDASKFRANFYLFDAETHARSYFFQEFQFHLTAAVFDGTNFWIANNYVAQSPDYPTRKTLTQVAPNGGILRVLELDPARQPNGVVSRNGRLWVSDISNSTVFFVDPPTSTGVPEASPFIGAAISANPVAGSGSVRIDWVMPSANGRAISAYTVTATDTTDSTRGGQTCPAAPPAMPQCSVTGLTVGDTYTFKVVSTNASGAGPSSAASAPYLVP